MRERTTVAPMGRRRRDTALGAGLACWALWLLFAAAGAAAAAPNWLDPADLSNPSRNASNPAVVMDAAGNTVALWEQQNTGFPSIGPDAAVRVPGGAFGASVDLAPTGSEPRLAITPSGEAVAAWKQLDSSLGANVVKVATRPPGGSFSPPVTVYAASSGVIPQDVQVAIGGGGTVAVTWRTVDPSAEFGELVCGTSEFQEMPVDVPCPNPYFVMGSVRPAGRCLLRAETDFPGARHRRRRGKRGRKGKPRNRRIGDERGRRQAGRRRRGQCDGRLDLFRRQRQVVQASVRPAGGDFGAPAQVSLSGESADSPST